VLQGFIKNQRCFIENGINRITAKIFQKGVQKKKGLRSVIRRMRDKEAEKDEWDAWKERSLRGGKKKEETGEGGL